MATDARWDMAFRRNNVRTFTIRLKGVDLTGKTMRQQVRLAPDTPGAPVIALETVTSATAEGLRLANVEVVDGVPVSEIVGRYNLTTMRDKLPYGGEVGDDYPMVHEIEIDGVVRLYGQWIARGTVMDSDNAPLQREPLSGQSARASADTVEVSATIAEGEVISVSIEGSAELGSILLQTTAVRDSALEQVGAMVGQARDYTIGAGVSAEAADRAAQFSRAVLTNYPESSEVVIDVVGGVPATGTSVGSTGFRALATAVVPNDGMLSQIEDWFTTTGTVAYWFLRPAANNTYTLFRVVPLTVMVANAKATFVAGADFAAFPVEAGDLFGPRLLSGQASIATKPGARYFLSTAAAQGAPVTFPAASSGDAPVTRISVTRTVVTTPVVPPPEEIGRAPVAINLPAGGPSYDVWNAVGQSQVALPSTAASGLPPNAVPSDARVPMQRIYETALAFDSSPMWGALANPDVTASPFVMSMVRGAGANIHGFCEGRQNPGGDDVGMVVMEMLSTTLGRSWTHTGRTLVKDVAPDGTVNRCANPRGSYNPLTGKLWLDWSWFARDGSGAFGLRAIYRDDRDGKWYGPNGEFVPGSGIGNTFNLSALTQPGWKRILSGPGAGDVGTDGKLYIPIWYEHPQYETYGTAVARLNDDGTATMIWYGGLFYDIVGEPTLVALENGRLHLNCRQRGTAYYARHILEIAVAGNIGTLVDHWIDTGLPDPHCEGSLTRLSGKGDGKPSRLVFVNCNSTTARTRLTARVSYRESAKGSYSAPAPLWPDSEIRFEDCLGGALATPVQIDHTGGYSAVCRIDDTHFAVLAQKNSIKPGGAVSTSGCLIFAIFSIGNAL